MKPILFNTDMVRALLEGRKTVTRRVVMKAQVDAVLSSPARLENPGIPDDNFIKCLCTAPCEPGDILYVRETWRIQAAHRFEADTRIEFKAGGPMATIQFPGCRSQGTERREYDAFLQKWDRPGWCPSIHMPKEAARLFLRVTAVRVERLQDITPEQARAEGCDGRCNCPSSGAPGSLSCVERDFSIEKFESVWDSTIHPAYLPLYGWDANPWVWVIEFERIGKKTVLAGNGGDEG